jgi:hypothetical protein
VLSDDERVSGNLAMSDRHQLLSDDERVKEKAGDERSRREKIGKKRLFTVCACHNELLDLVCI